MRLKTYAADNMAEAMTRIRQDMGRDAVIVSSRKAPPGAGRGILVTAAVDLADADIAGYVKVASPSTKPDAEKTSSASARSVSPAPSPAPLPPAASEAPSPSLLDRLRRDLVSHNTPLPLVERLLEAAERAVSQEAISEPVMAMSAALEARLTFTPLPLSGRQTPLLFAGPPGGGKTLAVVKLVTALQLQGKSVSVITTDTRRAGAYQQLAAFTNILGLDLIRATDAAHLVGAVNDAKAAAPEGSIVIDTAACNPYDQKDLDHLAELISAVRGNASLVLPAGCDALETADTAVAFSETGVVRLVATRLDTAQRIGGILSAADAGSLIFSAVSVSPKVADGLKPISSLSLARLIVPNSASATRSPSVERAAS